MNNNIGAFLKKVSLRSFNPSGIWYIRWGAILIPRPLGGGGVSRSGERGTLAGPPARRRDGVGVVLVAVISLAVSVVLAMVLGVIA